MKTRGGEVRTGGARGGEVEQSRDQENMGEEEEEEEWRRRNQENRGEGGGGGGGYIWAQS